MIKKLFSFFNRKIFKIYSRNILLNFSISGLFRELWAKNFQFSILQNDPKMAEKLGATKGGQSGQKFIPTKVSLNLT